MAAGALMIVTEFSTMTSVETSEGVGCSGLSVTTPGSVRGACAVSGHEQHHYALLVLGIVAIVMAVGAGIGRSRPAAAALLVIGIAVLVIGLFIDHPKLDDTRGFEILFSKAKGVAGPGFSFELIGGGLAVLAGFARLVFRERAEPA